MHQVRRKTRPDGAPYGDLRAESIRAECEASLRRLGVERIDLYQIHWPDPDGATPLEESWSTMAELVDEGKVRWIGVSNFDVDQLERCEAIRHVDSLQPPAVDGPAPGAGRCDPVGGRAPDGGDRLLADGLGAAEREPSIAIGSEHLPSDDMRLRRAEFTEPALSRNLALVERLRAIADEHGCTVAELAIAWTLAQDGVTGAIVGARRPGQLDAWLGAGDLELSAQQPPGDRRGDRRDGGRTGPARDRAAAIGDMMSDAGSTGEQVVARLQAAMNAHDVEAFVACFAEDYDSVQPAHPDRAFRGREQVRANWSEVFTGVPDFRAETRPGRRGRRHGVVEWRWQGTQTDGGRLDMAGVIVFGLRDDRVAWARLYVEPVEEQGAGIQAAVRDMTAER